MLTPNRSRRTCWIAVRLRFLVSLKKLGDSMRKFCCLWCVAIVIVMGLECQIPADDALAKLRYPLSKGVALRAPEFVLDLSEVADDEKAKAWGIESKVLCEEWFPVICRFLATEKWTPPTMVRLVLKRELAAPGVTSGHSILFSVKWITAHPDAFGMVIHELSHIVQAYPNATAERKPGGLWKGSPTTSAIGSTSRKFPGRESMRRRRVIDRGTARLPRSSPGWCESMIAGSCCAWTPRCAPVHTSPICFANGPGALSKTCGSISWSNCRRKPRLTYL